jgi:hypothetical protein
MIEAPAGNIKGKLPTRAQDLGALLRRGHSRDFGKKAVSGR